MKLFLIALVAMIGAIQAPPQHLPASIEGVVVKLGSGEPIANADIQLNGEVADILSDESRLQPRYSDIAPAEELHRKSRSDNKGHFVFDNVTPGEYRLIATYDGGYVPGEYGQRSPAGEGIPFKIVAGQKMTGIQLAMSATGAISGRIYDRDGEPLGNAQVLALRPIYKNGHRTLTIVQSVVSNDHGEYRLYWLAPGRYYVVAKPDAAEYPLSLVQPDSNRAAIVHITPPARFGRFEQAANPVVHKRKSNTGEVVEEMDVPVYYTNTVDMRAAVSIDVTGGATAGGVDISTGVGRITPQHIRGRVVDATGKPVGAATLTAMPRTEEPYVIVPRAQSAPDGTFDIGGVAPGSYQIFATIAGESRTLNGLASVDMGEKDIQNVAITMTAGFKLSGHFVREGNVVLPNGEEPSFPFLLGDLIRDPEIMGMLRSIISFRAVALNGSFTVEDVVPGDFRVSLEPVIRDGYIKSVRMGNVDVLNDGLHVRSAPDRVLDVVIGANAGRIEGTVVNSRNELLSNRTVVLVPGAGLRQRSDLYRVAVTDTTGAFRMQGITPGNYKLFAWENIEPGAWQDPDFIQAHEVAGRPIQINEGSNEKFQLPVIP